MELTRVSDHLNASHDHVYLLTSMQGLLGLFSSLGGMEISKSTLSRGLSPQKRWDCSGTVLEVEFRDSGVRQEIGLLFSSQHSFQSTLATCIQDGSIVSKPDEPSVFKLSNSVSTGLARYRRQEEFDILGLFFIAHIYPRDQTLNPEYVTLSTDHSISN